MNTDPKPVKLVLMVVEEVLLLLEKMVVVVVIWRGPLRVGGLRQTLNLLS
jgi:hypothetical protein